MVVNIDVSVFTVRPNRVEGLKKKNGGIENVLILLQYDHMLLFLPFHILKYRSHNYDTDSDSEVPPINSVSRYEYSRHHPKWQRGF